MITDEAACLPSAEKRRRPLTRVEVFAKRVALWLAVPHGEDLDILCRHSAPNESSRFYFFGKNWIGAEQKSGKKPRKNSVRGSRTITRAVLWGPQNGSGHSHCLCFAIVAQKCDELSLYFDLVTKSEQTGTADRGNWGLLRYSDRAINAFALPSPRVCGHPPPLPYLPRDNRSAHRPIRRGSMSS